MTLEEACRAGSFSVVKVTEGLDGVRHSARQLGETIMVTRLFTDPRLPAVLQPVPSAVRDPRFGLNRAAPAQVAQPRTFTTAAPTDPRLHLAVAPTDPRLHLGVARSDDPRLRRPFEALQRLLGMTWAQCFKEQFPT